MCKFRHWRISISQRVDFRDRKSRHLKVTRAPAGGCTPAAAPGLRADSLSWTQRAPPGGETALPTSTLGPCTKQKLQPQDPGNPFYSSRRSSLLSQGLSAPVGGHCTPAAAPLLKSERPSSKKPTEQTSSKRHTVQLCSC